MYILKAGQLKGYHFLRQRVIAGSIADFFCKELKLVIEVDGITHIEKSSDDKSRDEKLKNLGYTTIRIPDYDVFTDLAGVKINLEKWIDDYEKSNPEVLLIKDRKNRSLGKSSP
jgi:very-short-patch-repair endonuclease